MLSLAHGLSGAYLGSILPTTPYIYLPAAVVLHFIEDAVPHWDFGTGMHNGKRKKLTAAIFEVVELGVLAAIIFLLWGWNWAAWLGALGGILIDLLEAPNTFWHWQIKILKPISWLHQKVHESTTNIVWGLAPQVLVMVTVIFLTLHYPPHL